MPESDSEFAVLPANRASPKVLRRAGLVIPLLFVGPAVWLMVSRDGTGASAEFWRWITAGALALTGVAIGVLFYGLAARIASHEQARVMLMRLEDQQASLRAAVHALREEMESLRRVGETPQPTTPDLREEINTVLRGLAEVRELALMTDAQRQARRERMDEEAVDAARARIRYLIGEGDYRAAMETAETIARQRPNDPRATELSRFVEAARSQREAAEVAAVRKEVNDLLSMSAWPAARQKVQSLLEQHPDSAAARQLMVHIEKEYRQAMEEQRRRMYAEVQRFVTRKRWEEALAAARTFVERFEGSDDAEAVRMQIPTLEMNAEIEVRQQLEAQIMDLARHGRYIEAASLARRVIEQYPESPQAEALRSQIGRLEELATNPNAPPARIRIDEGQSRIV